MMSAYDIAMIAVIGLGAAVAFYALGRQHGYWRGYVDRAEIEMRRLRSRR